MNIYVVSPNKIWGGAATANIAIAEMLSTENKVFYNDEYFKVERNGLIHDDYPIHQLKNSDRFVQHLLDKKIDFVIWGVAMVLPFYRKASKRLKKLGVNQAVLFHSLAIDKSIKGKLMEWLIAASVKHVDHLVFVSSFTDVSWSKFSWIKKHSNHHVIYNPVHVSGNSKPSIKDFSKIGFVGRFSPEKQPEYFARLSIINSHDSFIAWGDGSMLESISKEYPNVSYKGHSSCQEEIYKSFGILVMTSSFENCPMVILEARAHGIPCVVPNVGGIPEIVRDNINGKLYSDYSPKNILDCIQQIQNNYQFYSNNCLNTITDYSYENLYKKWKSILNNN